MQLPLAVPKAWDPFRGKCVIVVDLCWSFAFQTSHLSSLTSDFCSYLVFSFPNDFFLPKLNHSGLLLVSQMSWIFLAHHSKSGPFPFSHLERPVIWPNSSTNSSWALHGHFHPCPDAPSTPTPQIFLSFSYVTLLKSCWSPTCSAELCPFTLALATSPISEPSALTVFGTPLCGAQPLVAGCNHLLCPSSPLCWGHVYHFAVFPEHFQSLGWAIVRL